MCEWISDYSSHCFLDFVMGLLDNMHVDTGAKGEKRKHEGANSSSPEKTAKGAPKDRSGPKSRLLMRGVKTSLATIRKLESEMERAFLFPESSNFQNVLGKSMKSFNASKPEKGEHPFGAPRCLVYATAAELALEVYQADEPLRLTAEAAFGVNFGKACTGLKTFVETTTPADVKSWDALVSFAKTKETRDGQQLFIVAPRRARFLSEKSNAVGLLDSEPEYLCDVICFPFMKFERTGPCPKGTMERQLEKALKGLSLDDEDENF